MTPPYWSGDGVEDSEEWLGRSMDCITVSIYLKRLLLIAATNFSDFAHYITALLGTHFSDFQNYFFLIE